MTYTYCCASCHSSRGIPGALYQSVYDPEKKCELCGQPASVYGAHSNPYFAKLRAMTDDELAAELSEEGVMKWADKLTDAQSDYLKEADLVNRYEVAMLRTRTHITEGDGCAAIREIDNAWSYARTRRMEPQSRLVQALHVEPDAPEGWTENPDWSKAPLQKEWPEEVRWKAGLPVID